MITYGLIIRTKLLSRFVPDLLLDGFRFPHHDHGLYSYIEIDEAQRVELIRRIEAASKTRVTTEAVSALKNARSILTP